MTTKEFIDTLCDIDFINKMEKVKPIDEVYAFAKRFGVTDSFEVFHHEIEAHKANANRIQNMNEEHN